MLYFIGLISFVFFVFSCFFIICSTLLYDGIPQLGLNLSGAGIFSVAAVIGAIAFGFSYYKSSQKVSSPTWDPASGFHPLQAVSLEKALHHLPRAQISNRNEEYQDQFT